MKKIDFSTELAEFSVDQEARTITGLAVPWGKSARNGGRQWRFERGGQRYAAVNRVKLLRDHDNAQAIGKAQKIEETDAGLVVTFKVSPGRAGDEALALAADEVLDGLSIGTEWRDEDYGDDPTNPGGFLVHQYAIREVSLTAVPAFDDSRLTSVRASEQTEEEPVMPENVPATPATPAAVETPAVAPAAPAERTFTLAEIETLRAAFAAPVAPVVETPAVVEPAVRPVVNPTGGGNVATFVNEPLPYRFTYQKRTGAMPGGRHIFQASEHDFSSDLFSLVNTQGQDHNAEKRVNALIKAAFDVDLADMAGTNPKRQAPELWQPQMDYSTPLWDMINSGGTDGTPFELPKFNSSSGMVNAAVEGVEPAPGAFTVTTQTITPTQLWGKVEITRQTIRRGGNPQTSGIIWDQMLREYYEDREAAVAAFLNTLTAAADIALTGTGATPTDAERLATARSLEAALASLQFVRGGNRFTAFAVHENLYRTLAQAADSTGRALYPMINPMNANGETQPLFRVMNIGGTTAVPAWALGAAGGTVSVNSWLFDPSKVRGWANAPERLEWNFGSTVQGISGATGNVPQLSHVTIGIYGDIALGNVDINGVRQVTFDVNTAA